MTQDQMLNLIQGNDIAIIDVTEMAFFPVISPAGSFKKYVTRKMAFFESPYPCHTFSFFIVPFTKKWQKLWHGTEEKTFCIHGCLTLPELGFYENLRAGGRLLGQRWKNMLYLRKFLSILLEILYIYCINMEQVLIKRSTNVTFVIIWWPRHESHVLTIIILQYKKIFQKINHFEFSISQELPSLKNDDVSNKWLK